MKPLSEKARDIIYQEYIKDPVFYTPRRLAFEFKVSLESARAIIILKNREQQMIARVLPLLDFSCKLQLIPNFMFI